MVVQLPVQARFETLAWPDRATLLLEAAPQLLPMTAGDTFGRVAGGWGLDGTNHLDLPLTAAELPASFAIACWVYLPDDFFATQYDSWILCFQGNEWVDGHVGICLGRNGVPRGVIDIGGGRENCTAVAASYADGRARGSRPSVGIIWRSPTTALRCPSMLMVRPQDHSLWASRERLFRAR